MWFQYFYVAPRCLVSSGGHRSLVARANTRWQIEERALESRLYAQCSLPVGDSEHLWSSCPSFSLVRCLCGTDYLQKSLDVSDLTFAKEVVGSWRFTYKPSFTIKVNACLQNRAPVPCSFPEGLGLKAAARPSPWKPPVFVKMLNHCRGNKPTQQLLVLRSRLQKTVSRVPLRFGRYCRKVSTSVLLN